MNFRMQPKFLIMFYQNIKDDKRIFLLFDGYFIYVYQLKTHISVIKLKLFDFVRLIYRHNGNKSHDRVIVNI